MIVGIYGTNPAGGGYHSISPTILIAHSQANMAVGGAGILSGMNPKGYIDKEAADQIVAAQIENAKNKVPAPGSVRSTMTRPASSVRFTRTITA